MLPFTPCLHVRILPVSADFSMGLPLTSTSPNPHWSTHSDFFAQCITFCVVYELPTTCLSLAAPMPRISLLSSTLVISSSFRYQLNPHPQTPFKNNLNRSNIIIYIVIVICNTVYLSTALVTLAIYFQLHNYFINVCLSF